MSTKEETDRSARSPSDPTPTSEKQPAADESGNRLLFWIFVPLLALIVGLGILLRLTN